jgi:hypothetical protein
VAILTEYFNGLPPFTRYFDVFGMTESLENWGKPYLLTRLPFIYH